MKHLILKVNPLPEISVLEIFEPIISEGKTAYPVRVNGLHMMIELSAATGWVTKGMAFSFETKVIQYIITLIESVAGR